MLSLLSPAKSQDFAQPSPTTKHSKVLFEPSIAQLADKLKHYEPAEFSRLMKISPKLAEQVFEMYVNFNPECYNDYNAKQAIFSFTGDVYRSLDATTLPLKSIDFLQQHLLILSGLYGLIRPLDLIQPYRLEMGTKFYINDVLLYDFWRQKLTQTLNTLIDEQKHSAIINLASNEYAKAIDKKQINVPWIEIDFKEFHNNKYQTIGIYAKRARGMMVRFIAENKLDTPEKVKDFNYNGYRFNPELSNDKSFCFTRVRP